MPTIREIAIAAFDDERSAEMLGVEAEDLEPVFALRFLTLMAHLGSSEVRIGVGESGDVGVWIGDAEMSCGRGDTAEDALIYAMLKIRDEGWTPGPSEATPLHAERDELWAAMQRIALNLCDCDAQDGEECPVEPGLHRGCCNYGLAHRAPSKEDGAPLEWDDNFSLADEEG